MMSKRWWFASVCLLFLTGTAIGTIIPNERLITWNPGVPGGIPVRTNIYMTLAVGASQSSIQTALNNCPSNQIVVLPAGTNIISSTLVIPSFVTLRGQGANTVLSLTGGGGGAGVCMGLNQGSGILYAVPASVSITSGYTKGSTNLVVSSTSGISVGDLVSITQDNPPFVSTVNADNGDGGASVISTDGNNSLMGQMFLVTGINGSNVSVTPPVYWDYQSSLNPILYKFGAPAAKYAGLENVKLYANNSGLRCNVQIDSAAYCWMKNVEGDFADGDHVWMSFSLGIEIRHCFFHDGFLHGPGTTDDSLKMNWKDTACLIVDNIFWRMHGCVICQFGSAGNVIAYNFATNSYHYEGSTNDVYTQIPPYTSHGAHPMFNLWEGNIGSQWKMDASHGSSSHNVVLRNVCTAEDWYAPPINTRYTTVDLADGHWETGYQAAFVQNWCSSSNSLVGNIAGSPMFVTTHNGLYLAISTNSYPGSACFEFGFSYDDTSYTTALTGFQSYLPWQSVLMQGNYDYKTATQHWDPTISDHSITNSYFLTSKPSWFGILNWPPFDPANPAAASITNIPAGYRFVYGVDPPASGGATNSTMSSISPYISQLFSVNPTTGKAPLTVNFAAGTQWGTNWLLYFGDGTASTNANPSHVYSSSGVYSVTLKNVLGGTTNFICSYSNYITVTN